MNIVDEHNKNMAEASIISKKLAEVEETIGKYKKESEELLRQLSVLENKYDIVKNQKLQRDLTTQIKRMQEDYYVDFYLAVIRLAKDVADGRLSYVNIEQFLLDKRIELECSERYSDIIRDADKLFFGNHAVRGVAPDIFDDDEDSVLMFFNKKYSPEELQSVLDELSNLIYIKTLFATFHSTHIPDKNIIENICEKYGVNMLDKSYHTADLVIKIADGKMGLYRTHHVDGDKCLMEVPEGADIPELIAGVKSDFKAERDKLEEDVKYQEYLKLKEYFEGKKLTVGEALKLSEDNS